MENIKYFTWKEKAGVKYLTFNHLAEDSPVTHAFISRDFNFRSSKQKSIQKAWLKETFDIEWEHLIRTRQIHGNMVNVITQRTMAKNMSGDGLITNRPRLPIAILTADCLPVFLWEPTKRVIGLFHAGWRGTLGGICRNAVYMVKECYQVVPHRLFVFFGPAIGSCCYSVGEEVANLYALRFADWAAYLKIGKKGQWKLNLCEANRYQLLQLGIRAENIIDSDLCTACNQSDFFSHRVEGEMTGRMLAVMMLN